MQNKEIPKKVLRYAHLHGVEQVCWGAIAATLMSYGFILVAYKVYVLLGARSLFLAIVSAITGVVLEHFWLVVVETMKRDYKMEYKVYLDNYFFNLENPA